MSGTVTGDTVEFSTDGGNTWLATNPGFVNVGTYVVKVRATNPNYETRYDEGTVSITARPLEITAGSKSKEYDGTPLTDNSYEITSGSLATGDELASVTVTGSQTEVGWSANVPKDAVIMRGENDVTNN